MSHIYVCLFSNGTIKVGRSKSPEKRIKQHTDRVSCVGVSLEKSIFFKCTGSTSIAEIELINACRDICKQRFANEWFSGLSFEKACEFASKFSKQKFDESCIGIRKLKVFIHKKNGNARRLALAIGDYPSNISDYANGKRKVPPEFAYLIERETSGFVCRKDLFPSNWHELWPELADKKSA